MAFLYFVGRILFVSVFLLSAWQELYEFGVDGGSAAKALTPKFNILSKHFTTFTGFQVPIFEIKFFIAGAIAMKAIGSFLFIFDSTIGATLLILHQLIATPILYDLIDFYNYDMERKKYVQLIIEFPQSLALLGGLLFFVGIKNSIQKISSVPNHGFATTQTIENVRDEHIEHMKDELRQARIESEIMFEKLKHTQARLSDTQEELSQCYQEITRLTEELKGRAKREGWFR